MTFHNHTANSQGKIASALSILALASLITPLGAQHGSPSPNSTAQAPQVFNQAAKAEEIKLDDDDAWTEWLESLEEKLQEEYTEELDKRFTEKQEEFAPIIQKAVQDELEGENFDDMEKLQELVEEIAEEQNEVYLKEVRKIELAWRKEFYAKVTKKQVGAGDVANNAVEAAETADKKENANDDNESKSKKEEVDLAFLELPVEKRPQSADLSDEQIKKELARLKLEKELRKARLEASLAEQIKEKTLSKSAAEKLEAEAELAAYKQNVSRKEEIAKLNIQEAELGLQQSIAKAKYDLLKLNLSMADEARDADVEKITDEQRLLEERREAALTSKNDPVYLEQPLLEDGTLVISDRRILLDLVITESTADDLTTYIEFYNNQDPTKPIFIVIDTCYGGSVMAGFHILNAMESSKAPIHVVVKRFAASMGAAITTLADESYVLPNAILLHHQMSSVNYGTVSDMRDGLEEVEEWWNRMAGPIAKKMGISLDDFIQMMYKNASNGDWTEFGDKALELKWANHIAKRVHETGIVEHPSLWTPEPMSFFPFQGQSQGQATNQNTSKNQGQLSQTTPQAHALRAAYRSSKIGELSSVQYDEKGKAFQFLPRINPVDSWYLHNPDNYFRQR